MWGFGSTTVKNIIAVHVTYCNEPNIYFRGRQSTYEAQKRIGWKSWDDNVLTMTLHDDLVKTYEGYFRIMNFRKMTDKPLSDQTINPGIIKVL